MISHKYKCIFIHISKCAGTSVEYALGVKIDNPREPDFSNLYGWSQEYNIWLQHATPQQLFDLKLINRDIWDTYYKFIIYRNSWSRAYSDYEYLKKTFNVNDTFCNFLNAKGDFFDFLDIRGRRGFVGDHLNLQKDYFFLDGERIDYNRVINFDKLDLGLNLVSQDLNIPPRLFSHKLNSSFSNKHYSYFYNTRMKKMVRDKYNEDIVFFNFAFEDKKNFIQKLIKG